MTRQLQQQQQPPPPTSAAPPTSRRTSLPMTNCISPQRPCVGKAGIRRQPCVDSVAASFGGVARSYPLFRIFDNCPVLFIRWRRANAPNGRIRLGNTGKGVYSKRNVTQIDSATASAHRPTTFNRQQEYSRFYDVLDFRRQMRAFCSVELRQSGGHLRQFNRNGSRGRCTRCMLGR